MRIPIARLSPAALLAVAAVVYAADKPKPAAAPAAVDPYTEVQPATESLDMTMYQRIRDEGLNHSHVMEFASALMDGIGPRLTGSPNVKKANEWTRDTLTKIGLENAHLEDWGEFGLGWQQMNTWARMVTPDTAVLILQATPWSPATPGPVTGDVVFVNIQSDKDFDQYKGKLAGKVVLYGAMRDVPPVDKPLFDRNTDKELDDIAEFPVNANAGGLPPEMQARMRTFTERMRMIDKIAQFFADEKVAAVIEPSRDGKNGGGSGGTFFDDNGATLGRTPYLADKRVKIPVAVAAIESYGRLYRLTQAHVPVSVEINVDTKFTGEHEHAYDTVAEIPGTDPKLKDQVVMLGGHLDSWIAGTGATDNGAGTVVAMEAVRILEALGVKPRRTIRIALWTGEEQGLFGSKRLLQAALRLCRALHCARSGGTAGVHAPRHRAARSQAGAEADLRLLQRRQRLGQDSRHLYAGQCGRCAHLCAVDRAAQRPRRYHADNAEHRRNGSPELRRSRDSGLPVHSGRSRLREPHASLQSGCRGAVCRRPT